MIKKSPSRNQRSKGLRVKHVLQICVLLTICFWLIYQVKHSRDKKKEFDAEVSIKAESVDGILKLGRKDLPRIEDVHKSEKHEEEEETLAEEEDNKHEEQQDEEASKHEEEDQEEVNKHEEDEQEEVNKNDEEEREEEENNHEDEDQEEVNKNEGMEAEGRGDGDDEIDENEQEKVAGQADHAEDFVDEENEEKEGQEESENSSNDQNQKGGGRISHEAREEHYKADDASSAVSHDVQIIGTENEKLRTENSDENSTIIIMGAENEANKTEETAGHENNLQLKSEEEKHTEAGNSLNNTIAEEKDHKISSYNSGNHSLPNATKAADSNDVARSKESTKKSAVVNAETLDSVQNGVATTSVSKESQNTTEAAVTTGEQSNQQSIELEEANNLSSSSNQLDANTTVSTKTENAKAATSEIIKPNATAEGGNRSESLTTKETTGATQNENSEGNHGLGGTDESTDLSSTNATIDESQHDPIDSSDSTLPQDEKDTRVDLSTLPDIRTEGSNTDYAAAE
ncbi:hypothetical protein SLE2022_145850 [Rubroshorea leprosula]